MKNTILIILIAITSHNYAQIKHTFFYNNNWELTTPKKAVYYRISSINDDSTFYDGEFTDYRKKDNSIIIKGCYKNLRKTGVFVEYYENGNVQKKGAYKDGLLDGQWHYYYPTGKLQTIIEFSKDNYSVVFHSDSAGNITLEEGTGIWKINTFIEVETTLTAKFKKGKKIGIWTYIDKNGDVILKEKYENNNFIWGKLTFKSTKKDLYKSVLNRTFFEINGLNIVNDVILERDLNSKTYPMFKSISKQINYSNSVNFTYLNSNLPYTKILAIAKDKNGSYWFGTNDKGLIKYKDSLVFFNTKTSQIGGDYITNVTIDKNDKVWFSYGQQINDFDVKTSGLGCVKNVTIKIFNTKNSGLTSNLINKIRIDDKNTKWMATLNCIVTYNDSLNTWKKHYKKDKTTRKIDTTQIHDENNYYKVAKAFQSKATEHKTIKPYKSNDPRQYKSENRISWTTNYEQPHNYTDIGFMRNENIIISSSANGIEKIKNSRWQTIDFNKNKKQVNELLTIDSTKLLISAFDSIIFYNDNLELLNTLFYCRVATDLNYLNESYWFIAGDRVINLKKNKTTYYYLNEPTTDNTFYCLFIDDNDTVWAGVKGGLILIE